MCIQFPAFYIRPRYFKTYLNVNHYLFHQHIYMEFVLINNVKFLLVFTNFNGSLSLKLKFISSLLF